MKSKEYDEAEAEAQKALELMILKTKAQIAWNELENQKQRDLYRIKRAADVSKWDKPKQTLPEPDFSLDEIEAAEQVMKDLG